MDNEKKNPGNPVEAHVHSEYVGKELCEAFRDTMETKFGAIEEKIEGVKGHITFTIGVSATIITILLTLVQWYLKGAG